MCAVCVLCVGGGRLRRQAMGCGASKTAATATATTSGGFGRLGGGSSFMAITKAKTIGRKMRLDADARAMAAIFGGVSIGKSRQRALPSTSCGITTG